MPTKYLVLDLPFQISEEEFLDKFLAATDGIGDQDDDFVEDDHRETPSQTITRFANDARDATITIWLDREARLRYLEISMPSEKALASASDAFERHFNTVEHSQVLQLVANAATDDSLPDNIFYQLAYSAPGSVSRPTVQTIISALSSPSGVHRQGAATAAGVLGWREFEAPLRAALAVEQDNASREAMVRALRVFP